MSGNSRAAAFTALAAVFAVVATVLVVTGGLFTASGATADSHRKCRKPINHQIKSVSSTADSRRRCRRPAVRVTKTVTATVTVSGPTQTVTVTANPTATVPGPTATVTATPTATATAPVIAPGVAHLPLFGAFPGYLSATDHSESYASRLNRVTDEFGGSLGVTRLYQGSTLTLPTMPGPEIVSWDFPLTETLAGQHDAQIDAIARGATQPLWFVPWHEVDNKKLAPPDYVALFRYIAHRVHEIGNPLVKMTPIFMGFTVKGMDLTTFNQFYPGDDVVDAIGFDTYVNPAIPAFATPEGAVSAPIKTAAQHGKPLVIGEVSLWNGYTDAQWNDFVGRIITQLDTPATDAVAWFETNKSDGDWRMDRSPAAVAKWAAVSSR